MKSTCLTLLAAALTFGLARAQDFSESFNTGSLPAGWSADPTFDYGQHDFADGRANVHATDAGLLLVHPLTVAAGTTKVVVKYTAATAYSGIGESTWMEFRTTGGMRYFVHHGYGDMEGSSGTLGAFFEVSDMNNPESHASLAYQRMPKIYATFSYAIILEDGKITQQIYHDGTLYNELSAQVPALRIADIVQVGLGLYTTTDASVWADDFSVSLSRPCLPAFTDTFDTLDAARWEIVSGSWTVSGGQLVGYWSQGAAQTEHANLLLASQDLNADYDAAFTAVLGDGATGFSLYLDGANKYNVNVGGNDVSVERRLNGSSYSVVASASFATPPTAPGATEVKLSRRGAHFTVTIAGQPVVEFTDDQWAGNLRLGLRAYSTAVYDSFSVTEPCGCGSGSDCALLQQLLDAADALVASLQQQLATAQAAGATLQSQLNQANADKAALQQQLTDAANQASALQAQLDQANADKAALQQQLAALTNQVGALQSQLTQANADKAALQQQLATATSQIGTLQSQLAQVIADKNALQQQLAARTLQVGALQLQLTVANAEKAVFQQQLASALSQLVSLQNANAALQGTVNSVDGSLLQLQANLRFEFGDPGFTLPGNSTAGKVSRLTNAIMDLKRAQKAAVYNALK